MNHAIAKQREPCSRSPNNTVKDVRPHVLYAVAILPVGRSSSSSSSIVVVSVVVLAVVVIVVVVVIL